MAYTILIQNLRDTSIWKCPSNFVLLALFVNQCWINDFFNSIPNAIHLFYPFHLIFSIELLRDTLLLCHLFYKLRKHFFCLLVNIGKVAVQTATEQQAGIAGLAIFFDVPQMPLTPQADRLFFLLPKLWKRRIEKNSHGWRSLRGKN